MLNTDDKIIDKNGTIITNKMIDPHHSSIHEWGWYNNKLYQKYRGSFTWIRVKKISFTPARIRILNKLVNGFNTN